MNSRIATYNRIFFDILVFAAILNAWWFVALPLALVGAWIFPYYLELILAGVVYDALFGMTAGLGIRGYAGTGVSVIVFVVVVLIKRRVR